MERDQQLDSFQTAACCIVQHSSDEECVTLLNGIANLSREQDGHRFSSGTGEMQHDRIEQPPAIRVHPFQVGRYLARHRITLSVDKAVIEAVEPAGYRSSGPQG